MAAACLENADETGLFWLRLEARRAAAYRELWWGGAAKTVHFAEECRALLAGTDAQQTSLLLGPVHAEARARGVARAEGAGRRQR